MTADPANPEALRGGRPHLRQLRIASAGFVLTGIATTLLGPILPGLAHRWSLVDVQSGALFAAQFVASTAGAALAPLHLRRALVLGYAALALGIAALPLAGFAGAVGALMAVGLGLGLTQTASNILVGAANPSRRGASLSLLNLWWGVGAVLCPALAAAFLRYGSLGALVGSLAGAAALVAVLLVPFWGAAPGDGAPGDAAAPGETAFADGSSITDRSSLSESSARPSHPSIFVTAGVLLFLYVGAETCVAGWLTTYSGRIDPARRGLAAFMPLFFWAALLTARGLVPVCLRRLSEGTVRRVGLGIALAGGIVLACSHGLSGVVLGSALAGAGLGPVFPVSVSLFLARAGESRRRGLVFAFCGLGGAALPWLMGLLSTSTGSLRIAFLVPAAALGCMLLMSLRRERSTRA